MSELVIAPCTKADFDEILAEFDEFWEAPLTRGYHIPILVNEFGNTAYVIKDRGKVVAYLFGFLSQTEPAGYVHLIAVRRSHRRQGLAERLYQHFADHARSRGCTGLKAITSPGNTSSIAFHRRIGMACETIKDYSGRGQDRVVLRKEI